MGQQERCSWLAGSCTTDPPSWDCGPSRWYGPNGLPPAAPGGRGPLSAGRLTSGIVRRRDRLLQPRARGRSPRTTTCVIWKRPGLRARPGCFADHELLAAGHPFGQATLVPRMPSEW